MTRSSEKTTNKNGCDFMKTANSPMNVYRRHILLCVGLLTTAGIAAAWLAGSNSFFKPLTTTLLAITPAALFCLWEWENSILNKTMAFIHNARFLNAALPAGFLLILLSHSKYDLSLFLLMGFVVSVWVADATLSESHNDLLMFLLLDVLAFCSLSAFFPLCQSSIFGLGFMSYLYFLRLICRYPLRDRNFHHCIHSMLAFAFAIVYIYKCISHVLSGGPGLFLLGERSWLLLDRTMTLLKDPRWLPSTHPIIGEWFGYDLGCFAEKAGLLAAIVVVGTTSVMLWFSGNLAFRFERKSSALIWGCWMILAVRSITYLLQSLGFCFAFTTGLPFFSGNLYDRMLDYLLVAVILQPLNVPALKELDSFDAEFPVLEAEALAHIPLTGEGLALLADYVFDHQERTHGWNMLFRRFRPLMDVNTLRIMVLNADRIFETDYFREVYPEFFQYSADPENAVVPEEIKTLCYSNSFIGSRFSFNRNGTVLEAYLGEKQKLLIPPFYNQIGFEAFRGNKKMEAVSIPNTVEKIDTCAFEGCVNLKVAELRYGLMEIGSSAFLNAGLKNVQLPKSLQLLGNSAFSETHLEDIHIPGSVSSVSTAAFADCYALSKVVLEEGVRYIEGHAFSGCCSLEEITIPASLRHIELNAFVGCPLKKINASKEWKEKHPDLLYLLTHPDFGIYV